MTDSRLNDCGELTRSVCYETPHVKCMRNTRQNIGYDFQVCF